MNAKGFEFYRGCFIKFTGAGVYICRLTLVNGANEWCWVRVKDMGKLEDYMSAKPYATPQYVQPEDVSTRL